MAASYAKDLPAGSTNHVHNIAIVGAGGRIGSLITTALINAGKHTVTAITRSSSTTSLPPGIHTIQKADYDSHPSLVTALTGQDVLIITLSVSAPRDTQEKLIDAAVAAGVKWIMPNEWGGAHDADAGVAKDTLIGERLRATRAYIAAAGEARVSSLGLCCGFWYEFSLAGTEARYGFDFAKKSVTFYDEGRGKLSTSTWPLCGRAVAAVLALKVLPEDESDGEPTLSRWRNGSVYVASFTVSQRDMFESVLRVTGDKEEEWKVGYEDVRERYKRGLEMMQKGEFVGFGILLYARMFYPGSPGDFSGRLDNAVLGLPEREDLDEATKVAVEMARRGETNAIH